MDLRNRPVAPKADPNTAYPNKRRKWNLLSCDKTVQRGETDPELLSGIARRTSIHSEYDLYQIELIMSTGFGRDEIYREPECPTLSKPLRITIAEAARTAGASLTAPSLRA